MSLTFEPKLTHSIALALHRGLQKCDSRTSRVYYLDAWYNRVRITHDADSVMRVLIALEELCER